MTGDLGIFSGLKNQTGTILSRFNSYSDTISPTPDEQGPSALINRKIVSLTNSPDNNSILYYEQNTGKVFEYDLANKNETTISNAILPNFISTIWSPTKKEVISAFYSQSGYDFKYYNYNTNKSVVLGSNIRSVAFSPDGSYVAYYLTEIIPGDNQNGQADTEVGRVYISQPNGSLPKLIFSTRIQDLRLLWPAKDKIVLATPNSGTYTISEDGKQFEKILDAVPIIEESWSKSGQKLLYSGLIDPENQNPILSIKNSAASQDKSLGFEGSASKCAWSIDDINIYCALARSPSSDNIYMVDTDKNTKKLVVELPGQAKELFLSSTEDYLIYISAADEKPYLVKSP